MQENKLKQLIQMGINNQQYTIEKTAEDVQKLIEYYENELKKRDEEIANLKKAGD